MVMDLTIVKTAECRASTERRSSPNLDAVEPQHHSFLDSWILIEQIPKSLSKEACLSVPQAT